MRSRRGTRPARPGGTSRSPFGLSPVWWLNVLLVAAATTLFLTLAEGLAPPARPHLEWWMLAPAFFVAERCVVHLHFRRSAHSFSLGDMPLVFGLIFAGSNDLMAGVLVGTSLTLLLD